MTKINYPPGHGAAGPIVASTVTIGSTLISAVGNDLNLLAGFSAAGETPVRCAKVALAALDTGGGVLAWAAPAALLVTRILLDVTTKSTGAGTLDVGYTTVNATTSSDTLIDGLDVGTAAGVFDNVTNKGTNGVPLGVKMASGKWITGSKASGNMAGLVGNAYIFYVLV